MQSPSPYQPLSFDHVGSKLLIKYYIPQIVNKAPGAYDLKQMLPNTRTEIVDRSPGQFAASMKTEAVKWAQRLRMPASVPRADNQW
jgi:hypothetical protein